MGRKIQPWKRAEALNEGITSVHDEACAMRTGASLSRYVP